MASLNYHHLYYFYVTAREGTIVKAAEHMHITPQTVSGQISAFEDYLGIALFERKGKRLVLNEAGKMAYSYAEDIFSLGSELQHALNNEQHGRQFTFAVGITDVLPKVFAFDLLKSCFDMDETLRLVCHEGDIDSLLVDLALNRIDLILSDRPLMPGARIKAYSHSLGESGITFFTANKRSARQLAAEFPNSLDQQNFLISGEKSTLKINLMSWFDELQITPNIVAEFDDSALTKLFGQAGYGIFCTPSTIEEDVQRQYNVAVIGRTHEIKEQFYAISPERKLKHPGVRHLFSHAKTLFNS